MKIKWPVFAVAALLVIGFVAAPSMLLWCDLLPEQTQGDIAAFVGGLICGLILFPPLLRWVIRGVKW